MELELDVGLQYQVQRSIAPELNDVEPFVACHCRRGMLHPLCKAELAKTQMFVLACLHVCSNSSMHLKNG